MIWLHYIGQRSVAATPTSCITDKPGQPSSLQHVPIWLATSHHCPILGTRQPSLCETITYQQSKQQEVPLATHSRGKHPSNAHRRPAGASCLSATQRRCASISIGHAALMHTARSPDVGAHAEEAQPRTPAVDASRPVMHGASALTHVGKSTRSPHAYSMKRQSDTWPPSSFPPSKAQTGGRL